MDDPTLVCRVYLVVDVRDPCVGAELTPCFQDMAREPALNQAGTAERRGRHDPPEAAV